jgi:SynChlorMet cassette radical SAM/SPASM protein ScmE
MSPNPRLWKTPQTIELAITNKCNLRCKYCYYFASPADAGEDLPLEEWLKFFEELNRCNVMNVLIAGGEPLCREDLREILDGVARNNMRYTILTNGTLMTDDMAKFIASTRRCNRVQVSIDGSIPATHDACRGAGSFERAIEGIRCLRRNGVPVAVRVTVHRDNVNDLEDIAHLLLEEIGLRDFSINSVSYLGKSIQNADQVLLTPEERSLAMATMIKLDKKYKGRINASAGPLAQGKNWMTIEKARRDGIQRLFNRGYLVVCKDAMKKLAVRADGVMIPCNQMSHRELGKINVDSLQEVWLNHPELKRLRERRKIPLSNFEFCSGCDYINYCAGSCPAMAYSYIGDEDHPSPDSCLKRFLEAGGRLPAPDTIVQDGCGTCE